MNSRHDDKLEIGDLSSFEDTKGRYVITCGSSLVVPAGDSDFFWSHEALEKRVPAATRSHFLGRYNGELFFAVEIPEGDQSALGGELCSLRSLLGKLSEGLFKLLGRAVQITGWYRDHRYCGRCGAETVQLEHDRAMACPRCDMVFYPRLSPCIMALITRGDECLLARNASWQLPMYSVLAGFIEPGESVEEALRREVMEEVGLEVGSLHYFDSQPWPFPGQLMIGFFADYAGGEIEVDGVEIAEANWYHYRDLPPIPGEYSLSGQLIRSFIRQCEQRNGF